MGPGPPWRERDPRRAPGESRPRLTYWLFRRLAGEGRLEWTLSDRFPDPERLRALLPLVRSLGERLEASAYVRDSWTRFVLWRGPRCWYVLDQLSDLPREPLSKGYLGRLAGVKVAASLEAEVLGYAREEPEAFEAGVRLLNLFHLGEACALGMDPLPRLREPQLSTDEDGLIEDLTLRGAIAAWLREHEDDVPRVLPASATPLAGWEGPVPEFPL